MWHYPVKGNEIILSNCNMLFWIWGYYKYRQRNNADLVPKFHVALHASDAALRTVTPKISP
jgi:hypothetical protein